MFSDNPAVHKRLQRTLRQNGHVYRPKHLQYSNVVNTKLT